MRESHLQKDRQGRGRSGKAKSGFENCKEDPGPLTLVAKNITGFKRGKGDWSRLEFILSKLGRH